MTRQVIAHSDLYNDLCVFINARRRTRNARTRTRILQLADVADVKHIRFASRSTIK